jgi:Cyclin, N-terminal domain
LALLTLQAGSPFRLPAQQILSTKSSPLSEEKRGSAVSLVLNLSRVFAKQAAVPALATYYFDAFLAHCAPRSVREVHTPVVAAACFLVAIKMLDPVIPTTEDIAARLKGPKYDPELILNCELHVCVSLNFDFCLRVPHNVIPHLCKLATGAENVYAPAEQHQATNAGSTRSHIAQNNITRKMDFALESDNRKTKAHVLGSRNDTTSISSNSKSPQIKDNVACLGTTQMLLVDRDESRRETAMAFADLALYCSRLLPVFGVGEISAACTMIASLGDETEEDVSFKIGNHWLPLFDLAELNCFRVFAVVASICDKLGDLLLVRALAAQYRFHDLDNISELLQADSEFAKRARRHRDTVVEIFDCLTAQLDPCGNTLQNLCGEDKVQTLLELAHANLTSEDDATTWLKIFPKYSIRFYLRVLKRLRFAISELSGPACDGETRRYGRTRRLPLGDVTVPGTNVVVPVETSQSVVFRERLNAYKLSAIVKKKRSFARDQDDTAPIPRMVTRSQARKRVTDLSRNTPDRGNSRTRCRGSHGNLVSPLPVKKMPQCNKPVVSPESNP